MLLEGFRMHFPENQYFIRSQSRTKRKVSEYVWVRGCDGLVGVCAAILDNLEAPRSDARRGILRST